LKKTYAIINAHNAQPHNMLRSIRFLNIIIMIDIESVINKIKQFFFVNRKFKRKNISSKTGAIEIPQKIINGVKSILFLLIFAC
jgi:hypothetical protein